MFNCGSKVLGQLAIKTFTAKSFQFRSRSRSRSRSLYRSPLVLVHLKLGQVLALEFSSCKRCFGSRTYSKDNSHQSQAQNQLTRELVHKVGCFCLARTLTTGPRRERKSGSRVDNDRLVNSTTPIKMAQSSLVVGHDESSHYFYILLEGNPAESGPTAKLEYAWIRPNVVDLYHTEVPTQFRGQGVAKVLAKAAFDFFSEKDVTIRPSCTYLQKYLRENPVARYMDRVEKNFLAEIQGGS